MDEFSPLGKGMTYLSVSCKTEQEVEIVSCQASTPGSFGEEKGSLSLCDHAVPLCTNYFQSLPHKILHDE